MKKISLFFLIFMLMALPGAATLCDISAEEPIHLMEAEMKRGFKTYKKQKPSIYYLSYSYHELLLRNLRVYAGGVASKSEQERHALSVLARAGSTKMDNSRYLKGEAKKEYVAFANMPFGEKPFSIVLWGATERAIKSAQEGLSQVQSNNQVASKRADDSPDFVMPPVSVYCRNEEYTPIDMQKIEDLLKEASLAVLGNKIVLGSSFVFSQKQGHTYFLDSNGTKLKTPVNLGRIAYEVWGKKADGAYIERGNSYDIISPESVPSLETLVADVKKSLAELEALFHAPDAEPLTAPAILKNKAMGVFVHEILGHRVEGHRQKIDSFGKTFTDKVGQQIMPSFLSIVDDPTMAYFKNIPLRGFYEYDDEGVKAQSVTIVENGVLKNFLMNASPIKGFPVSNGHGRASLGNSPVARMGVTRLVSSQSVSYEELEKMLIEEIKKQGKPYGFIIEDLSGGFTQTDSFAPQTFKLEPTLVYRVYPDGKKEFVRGADLVGTPLVSFSKILATADDDDVFNGNCGAESGWVPVSAIAPSVLLESIEVEKTAKSSSKPPQLPSPFSLPERGNK